MYQIGLEWFTGTGWQLNHEFAQIHSGEKRESPIYEEVGPLNLCRDLVVPAVQAFTALTFSSLLCQDKRDTLKLAFRQTFLYNPSNNVNPNAVSAMKRNLFATLTFIVVFGTSTIHAQEMQECFPAELLPDHIIRLTDFGQRSEWSHDGERVFFVDRAGGEVFMVNVNTKETTQITNESTRPEGDGYYRVFELWNGDLLLGHGPERHVLYFQILDESLEFPAHTIEGENFDEGPAVSRTTNKIAWTLPEQEQIYTGRIMYDETGQPHIEGKQLLVDNSNVVDTDGNKYEEILESQDWAPGEENILVWNQYHVNEHGFRADIMSIDLESRTIVNHTKAEHLYHEAEGIFPNPVTTYTLVESDQHDPTSGTGTIDLYKLEIDRDAAMDTESYNLDEYMERLTFFSDTEGYRSSNGVISDDGEWMVFQGSISGTDAGVGCGLYLYDLRHE